MATQYQFSVYPMPRNAEFSDAVETGIRAEVESVAQQMELGRKVLVQRDKEDTELTHHYYHNGRITVRTMKNQMTANQRHGLRSF